MPTPPPLSLELWARIIAHLPLPHLARTWFALRRCSRLVRAAAEAAYLTRHVARNTRLVFDAGGYDVEHLEGLHEDAGRFAVPFRFGRVDGADRGRVVFGVDWDDLGVWAGRRGMGGGRNFGAWVRAVRWYVEGRGMGEEGWGGRCRVGRGGVARPDCPVYTVVVGRVVNDTELPGLEVDFEGMEVAFEWRGMLDRLLGEEEAVRKQCPEERAPAWNDDYAGGRSVRLGDAWAACRANLHSSVYQDVRRRRILRQYRAASRDPKEMDTEEQFQDRERRGVHWFRHEVMKDDRMGVLFMDPVSDSEDEPPAGFVKGKGRAWRR